MKQMTDEIARDLGITELMRQLEQAEREREEARQIAQYYFDRYRYLLCSTRDWQSVEFEDENAKNFPWLAQDSGNGTNDN